MEQQQSSHQTIHYTQLSGDSRLQRIFQEYEQNQKQKQKRDLNENQLFLISDRPPISPPSPSQSQMHRGYNSDNAPEKQYKQHSRSIRHTHIINKSQKKKSKKRTRIYIQMLQTRVTELQTQIDRLRKLNKINRQYITRLKGADSLIDGFFIGRQQIFEKLEKLNETQQKQQEDETKAYQVLKNLRQRQGVYGKDRLKTVNYYFQEMVEMLLPQIQKYIIKTAIQETDLFDQHYIQEGEIQKDQSVQQWRKKILEQINLPKSSKRQFYALRPEILKQANQFKILLNDFYETKCKLTKKARSLQQLSDSVRRTINPKKLSKVLCYIDKYKYEKNVSLQNTFDQVFKKIKKQSYCYSAGQLFMGNNDNF